MKRNAMYVLMGVIVCAAKTVVAASSFAHERRTALAAGSSPAIARRLKDC